MIIYASGDGEKFIYNRETKSSQKILDKKASYTSWSHDSKRIYYLNDMAFISKDQNYYSINTDGGDKRLFIKNKPLSNFPFRYIGRIGSPIYSSLDGRYLLYARNCDDQTFAEKVYVMDTQTNETAELGYGSIGGWTFLDKMPLGG